VVQLNIQKLERQGRILVELPGVKEPERVTKLLTGTANLEFWTTYQAAEVWNYLDQANQYAGQYSGRRKMRQLQIRAEVAEDGSEVTDAKTLAEGE
jgi:SecD/SecF fusion protein